jgi:NIMA (never in mitosis gene a)-related kinase
LYIQENTNKRHVEKKSRASTNSKHLLRKKFFFQFGNYLFTIIFFAKQQASEVLKHPYLQPYVDQYRPSFAPQTAFSPEKPISAVNITKRHMAESQNSTSSSSDKDSLMSNDRNIATTAPRCDSKATDMDIDDDGSENLQEVIKSSHNEQHSNVESKPQPRTIRNIMMALKEGRGREATSPMRGRETTSPMRGSRVKAGGVSTPKVNTDVPSKLPKPTFIAPSLKPNLESLNVPLKASPDSSKRIYGSPHSKLQVHYLFKFDLIGINCQYKYFFTLSINYNR